MRRILLITLTALLLLSGCEKKIEWAEIESTYIEAENEAKDNINTETVVKEDYEGLLTELGDYIEDAEFSQNQDNQDLLKRAYRVAEYIELFASLFKGNCAQQLLTLAVDSKNLVKSVYSGDEQDFNNIKSKIQNEIQEISSWADEEWNSVSKKIKVNWEDVAAKIEEIDAEARENVESYGEVLETTLDDLKHTIVDNYDLIKDGVTEDTNEIAQKMYSAAVQLEVYTKRIYSDEADKVYYFAKDCELFIKEKYGKVLDETEEFKNDFTEEIEAAKKWTQSTWNVITAQLKSLAKQ